MLSSYDHSSKALFHFKFGASTPYMRILWYVQVDKRNWLHLHSYQYNDQKHSIQSVSVASAGCWILEQASNLYSIHWVEIFKYVGNWRGIWVQLSKRDSKPPVVLNQQVKLHLLIEHKTALHTTCQRVRSRSDSAWNSHTFSRTYTRSELLNWTAISSNRMVPFGFSLYKRK